MCSMSVYRVQISENTPVRSQVLTIEAFDDDVGQNSELEFSITGGDIGVFQIDGRSLLHSCLLSICILPITLCSSLIGSQLILCWMSHLLFKVILAKSQLLLVLTLRFRLLTSSQCKLQTVEHNQGQVSYFKTTIFHRLCCEISFSSYCQWRTTFSNKELWKLMIACLYLHWLKTYDLTGSCMVEIEVLDFNDCPPTFVTPLTSTTVLENAVNGTVIVEYTVRDCDSGRNGVNGTTFTIIAGTALSFHHWREYGKTHKYALIMMVSFYSSIFMKAMIMDTFPLICLLELSLQQLHLIVKQ